ncbi:MAG: hypothetical protein ACREAZ_06455 [Nitrososphaera sp.]
MTTQRQQNQGALYVGSQAWQSFLRGIKTDKTFTNYTDALKFYMRWLKISDPDKLLDGPIQMLENQIIEFIADEKAKGKSQSVISQRVSAVKLFYEMNRKPLSWAFIRRTIPKTRKRKDRAYTLESHADHTCSGLAEGLA